MGFPPPPVPASASGPDADPFTDPGATDVEPADAGCAGMCEHQGVCHVEGAAHPTLPCQRCNPGGFAACPFGCAPSGVCRQVMQIDSAMGFNCVLLDDRTVWCWGAIVYNNDGTTVSSDPHPPRQIAGLEAIVELALGFEHACARTETGALWCWGRNHVGQLGNPQLGTVFTEPVPVTGLGAVRTVAAGGYTTCVLGSDDHALSCFGATLDGQDVWPVAYTVEPRDIDGFAEAGRVDGIAVNVVNGCGLVAGGSARCWGDNAVGQLGTGDLQDHASAQPLPQLGGALDVLALGFRHVCATVDGGQLVTCWGHNDRGQTGGDPNTLWAALKPVDITPWLRPPVTAIAAALNHTCVIQRDGEVVCWGDNDNAELGILDTTIHQVPVTIAGLGPSVALSAELNHTCALSAGGTVRCWGSNLRGELDGERGATHQPTPLVVGVESAGSR